MGTLVTVTLVMDMASVWVVGEEGAGAVAEEVDGSNLPTFLSTGCLARVLESG
jgi:hypothetical protein